MDHPVRDKPWRPADYPSPGPSWDEEDRTQKSEPKGVPNAED